MFAEILKIRFNIERHILLWHLSPYYYYGRFTQSKNLHPEIVEELGCWVDAGH